MRKLSRFEKRKNLLRDIARMYDCKVVVSKIDSGLWGGSQGGKITINKKLISEQPISKVLSILYHEIGHRHCEINGIFPLYHSPIIRGAKDARAILRTAWRAERYVEVWAEREMKFFYPHIPYHCSYHTKRDKLWLLKYWRECLNKYLKSV